MRDLDIPTVRDPQRYLPDPEFRSQPPVRELDDGTVQVQLDGKDRWENIHPIFRDLIHALQEAEGFDDLVDHLGTYPEQRLVKRSLKAKVARKFLWRLHRHGHVHLPLPEPPKLFHGRYRRVELLGRGGPGVAHLCHDTHQDDAPVVVKHPWGVKQPIEYAQRSLTREIAAYESVADHPNVPTLHGTFQGEDGLLHMVRDYVDGRSLRAWARETPAPDPEARVAMMHRVAQALHGFHERGFLYMDTSPGNFMVEADGHLVVSDLGALTPMEEARSGLKGARGTRGYRAPEVTNRLEDVERHATVRSEVYSLGCLHYALTVGTRTSSRWWEEDLAAALDEHDVPPHDRHIIQTCCRDDPGERPRDMLEVQNLLVAEDPR